jgi:hypothetical protein
MDDRHQERENEIDNDILKKKFVSNRPFNIQKALEVKVPKIVIPEFPKNTNLEETGVFRMFLKPFNIIYDTEITIEDLMFSRSNFRAFVDFMLYCSVKGHILIQGDNAIGDFIEAFENLQKKYMQNLRSIEKYYDEIVRSIYYPQGLTKKDPKIKEEMYLFEQAYALTKLVFRNNTNEAQKKYFDTLKETIEKILKRPNPNLNKIIVILLNDIVQKIPTYEHVIRKIYGDYIADEVKILSDKKWEEYLTEKEREQMKNQNNETQEQIKKIGKERRNKEYFDELDAKSQQEIDDPKDKEQQKISSETFMKKFVGNNKFNVQKALKIKIPKITITEITKDIKIEDTHIFHTFLKPFNEIYDTDINIEDLMHSKSNFRAFSDFIMYC